MIPESYLEGQQKRIEKLSNFILDVETDIFSKEKLKGLSLEKVYERYALAKEMLNKEIDNSIKITKNEENLSPETKLLLGLVMSLTSDEKKKLKEAVIQIKKASK